MKHAKTTLLAALLLLCCTAAAAEMFPAGSITGKRYVRAIGAIRDVRIDVYGAENDQVVLMLEDPVFETSIELDRAAADEVVGFLEKAKEWGEKAEKERYEFSKRIGEVKGRGMVLEIVFGSFYKQETDIFAYFVDVCFVRNFSRKYARLYMERIDEFINLLKKAADAADKASKTSEIKDQFE